MKKNILLFLICCAVALTVDAQDCRSILNQAKAAYGTNLKQALKKLQDTEDCDRDNELLKERQALQNDIFKAIDDQRIKAQDDAKKVQESANKVLESEAKAQIALRTAQVTLDSLHKVLETLDKANADKVRLILAEVKRNQRELNFDAAVDKIKTAKILRALPDSVNLAYQNLSRALLNHARADLQHREYKSALAKTNSAGELNIQPDSVAAAREVLRHFLFENARLDILHTAYDAAVEKINAVSTLSVSADTVASTYLEIAFCCIETGRLDRAAGLLDTIAQLRNNLSVRTLLQGLAGKEPAQKKPMLRQASQQLDPLRSSRLLARYFSPLAGAIPGGTLLLGGESGDESRGSCSVTIAPFLLNARELTFVEYDLFCAATNRRKPSDNGWGRGQRPVIDIDWYDAVEYCNWRSRQEDLQEVYVVDKDAEVKVTCNWSAKGYRLPTETEWEFAAGNGEKHTQYSWGNEPPTAQNGGNVTDEAAKAKFPDWETFGSYSDGFVYTAPTGSFQPNDFGLYDMTGNVWEWCWDRYELNYCRPNKNKNAAQGPVSGTERVLRGGSWGSFPKDCFVSNRFHNRPDTRNYSIGFRLARNEKTL